MLNKKKESLMEAVRELHDPEFKVPNGFLIPLRNQLYIKQEQKSEGLNMTESGIIVPSGSDNTVIPLVGIIYAVGDEVSDFLFPGLKVAYQGDKAGQLQYMEVMINGHKYLRMYEHEVLGILPPRSYVYQGIHSEAYIRRMKRFNDFENLAKNREKREANEKDKKEELSKKTRK